jgi:hypothetical protein
LKRREKQQQSAGATQSSSAQAMTSETEMIKEPYEVRGIGDDEEHQQNDDSVGLPDTDQDLEASNSLQERLTRMKGAATKTLSPLGRAGKIQLQTFKDEGKDLKELLASKQIVIYKTDAVAIVLRKLGRFFEFLDEYNKLVQEGYSFVYSEPVESFFEIPITGIKTKLGKLYYFHHQKYADVGASIVPNLTGYHHGHAMERARDTDDVPLPVPASNELAPHA